MPTPITSRLLREDDAAAVAQPHAESPRAAHRDILSAAYLASAVDADEIAVWTRIA